MIAQGSERLRDFKNVHLFETSGRDLSMFENNFFDFVFSYITFQHIPRCYVHSYFQEAQRVLKSTGIFRFQMQSAEPGEKPEPTDTDFRTVRFYSADMLKEMPEHNGFKLLEIEGIESNKKSKYLYLTLKKL